MLPAAVSNVGVAGAYCIRHAQKVAEWTQKDLEKIWLKAKARHPTHRVGGAMSAAAIICWAPAFPAVYGHFYG